MLQAFRTVGALIEHYRSGSASGVTLPPLTHPLDKTRIQCLNHGEGRTRAQRQTSICAAHWDHFKKETDEREEREMLKTS